MPTEASSRAGLTISGKPSAQAAAIADTSGVVRKTASGVDTPRARRTSFALCLCSASASESGPEPV